MLDLDGIDLGDLRMALDDHSPDHSWLLDPATGAIHLRSDLSDEPFEESRRDQGADPDDLIPIEPWPSQVGYGDMEDFIEQVRDPRARDLLWRAIAGRGAFRRFKDALTDYPELREAWYALSGVQAERRAIEWLRDERLIDSASAEAAIAARPDPVHPELGDPFDPGQIAREVAAELSELYGERLRDVIMFGSWARGDAHRESDIDLLVVLDRVEARWAERDRIDRILYRHSLKHDTLVSATVCSELELRAGEKPLFAHISGEGQSVR